ncbi:MAG: two-component regulator propeller domain-containing protein, partial [Dyadobacter sp.]
MKFIFFWLLLIPLYSSAQSVGDQKFIQEIVTIHSIKEGLPEGKVNKIYLQNGFPIAEILKQKFQFQNGKWTATGTSQQKSIPKSHVIPGREVLSYVVYKGGYAVGCDEGLYFVSNGKKPERIFPENEKYDWSLKNVSALVTDSKGRLWVGAEEGIGYLDGKSWKLFTGKEGLPYNKFTCSAAGPDETVWFGTEKGIIEVKNDYFKYRFSRRW